MATSIFGEAGTTILTQQESAPSPANSSPTPPVEADVQDHGKASISGSEDGKNYNLKFAEHGDVVLVLPLPNSGGTARFQVSSSALCLASPVFQAMFGTGSSFKEAKTLAAIGSSGNSTRTPLDVPLDDDPNAFAIILTILHFHFDLVPTECPAANEEQLYAMAIICDKYDMKRALGYWFRTWTSSISKSTVATKGSSVQNSILKIQGPRWLFMSYAFAHQELFERISLELILECRLGKGDRLYLPNIKNGRFDDYMPQPIIDEIVGIRQRAMEAFLACVYKQVQQYISPDPSTTVHKCQLGQMICDATILGLLILEFRKLGVYPEASTNIGNLSVMELLRSLSTVRFPPHITISKAVEACCNEPEARDCHTGSSYCIQCRNCNNCGRILKPTLALRNHLPLCSPLPKYLDELQEIMVQITGLNYSRFVRDKTQPFPGPTMSTDQWNIIPYA